MYSDNQAADENETDITDTAFPAGEDGNRHDEAPLTEEQHHHHHSHHHSHHHRHDSGRHSRSGIEEFLYRSRRLDKKVKKGLWDNRFFFLILLAVLAVLGALLVGVLWGSGRLFSKSGKLMVPTHLEADTRNISVSAADVYADVVTVTDSARGYLTLADDIIGNYTLNDADNCEVPFTLPFMVYGLDNGESYAVLVRYGTNEDFSDSRVEYLTDNPREYTFRHLLTDATYYYEITLLTKTDTVSTEGSFRTADTARLLTVDGIKNVRDIGGVMTESGKKIREGLLLRGSEMDGYLLPDCVLTYQGQKDLLAVFGIRTDFDLRAQDAGTKDALGISVLHRYYDMPLYTDIFTDDGMAHVRAVFSDLADASLYPMYLHCSYGIDRSGTVCYLLEGLLGASEADCLRDYCVSCATSALILETREGLRAYEGASLSAQIRAYLHSCGVTMDEISSIYNIFLEK